MVIINSFCVQVGLNCPMDTMVVTHSVAVTTTPIPRINPGSVGIRLTGLDTCNDVIEFDSNGIKYLLHRGHVFSSDIFGEQ